MSERKVTYGIIGLPVEHSLSPSMHNAAFKELGLNAVYKLFPLQEDEIEDFFADLRSPQSPIFGLNVTVPYKERVLEFMDLLSPFVEKVRAVNTIEISQDRKFTGHNTDGPGFLAHLSELNFDTTGRRIAILGAGGTSRAILAALCLILERPQSIRLYNRTMSNAEAVVHDLGKRMDVGRIEVVPSVDDLNLELADLLINTTSLGLHEGDECLIDEESLHPHLWVYDVIYNPRGTPLIALARKRHAKTADGLGMLFYQGVLALQHWAQMELEQPVKDKMRQSLEKAAGLSTT